MTLEDASYVVEYIQAAYGQPWHPTQQSIWLDQVMDLATSLEHGERAARWLVAHERFPTVAAFREAVEITRVTDDERDALARSRVIESRLLGETPRDPKVAALLSATVEALGEKANALRAERTAQDPVDTSADLPAREKRREHLRRQAEHLRLIEGGAGRQSA